MRFLTRLINGPVGFLERRISEIRIFHLPRILSLIAGLSGAVLILVSFYFSWFSVPLPTDPSLPTPYLLKEAPTTLPFKFCFLLTLMNLIVLSFMGIVSRQKVCIILGCLLGILLFFPALNIYFSPRESGIAAWYSLEQDMMTWLGGDVYTSQEKGFFNFKQDVIVTDHARDISIVPIPKSIPSLLQFSSFAIFFEYLGYTESFTRYSSRGWHMAIWGIVLLLTALIRPQGGVDYHLLRLALAGFTFCIALCIPLFLAPVFVSAQYISKAHQRILNSKYQNSLDALQIAEKIFPPLSQSSTFLMQKGLIQNRLGLATYEARFFQATQMEKIQRIYQSQKEYLDLLEQVPSHSVVGRECIRSLTRHGIYLINSAKYDAAIELLSQVMKYNHLNVKANYALQIAYIKSSRVHKIPELDRLLESSLKPVHSMKKRTILAISRHNHMLASYLMGDLKETLKLKRP
ncbi:MAG: hypothetical protein H3C47_13615 [Candidatus Cloacimonetes bacterium]|nr:hypothetical protein [Candidatus Cloacimonadota bacterium]